MSLRRYLVIMIMATVICWVAFFSIIWSINPFTTNGIGFFLFYTSLFLSLVGTAAIVGFSIRFVALKKELAFQSVTEAFRQSFLFALLIVASLFLLSHSLASWFNLVFLVLGVSVLEFFLVSYKKPV